MVISSRQTAVSWPRGTSERRGPGRERLFKHERLGDGKTQRANRKRHKDMNRQNSNMWVCPHLLDCVWGQKREEDSGRNKTINMNSTLGNACFLDNSGHSQTNEPFHNRSKQTETSPLLAPWHWLKTRHPLLASWRTNSCFLPKILQLHLIQLWWFLFQVFQCGFVKVKKKKKKSKA